MYAYISYTGCHMHVVNVFKQTSNRGLGKSIRTFLSPCGLHRMALTQESETTLWNARCVNGNLISNLVAVLLSERA